MIAVQYHFYFFARVSDLLLPKKIFVTSIKAFHVYFSIWLRECVKYESSISFAMSGPMNIVSLIFSSLSFCLRNWNAEPSFTLNCMNPNLQGWQKILSDSTKGSNLMFVPLREWCAGQLSLIKCDHRTSELSSSIEGSIAVILNSIILING